MQKYLGDVIKNERAYNESLMHVRQGIWNKCGETWRDKESQLYLGKGRLEKSVIETQTESSSAVVKEQYLHEQVSKI